MKCTYTFGNKELTESQLIKAFLEELTAHPEKYNEIATTIFSVDPQRDLKEKLSIIATQSKDKSFSSKYIGVSRWLDHKWQLDGPESAPRPLAPIYNEENRINEYVNAQKNSNVDPDKAKEDILNQIADEKIGAGLGSLIHKFIELGFNEGLDSQEYKDYLNGQAITDLTKIEPSKIRSIYDLVTSKGSSHNLTPQGVIEILEKTARNIITEIKDTYGEDALYYPEFEMISTSAKVPGNEEGIVGKADLIVVTKQGELIIYDFKTSSKRFEDWFAAKSYHTDYQLGVYRQILKSHGIDTSKAKLIVKPIQFDRTNIGSLLSTKGGLIVESDKNRTAATYNGVAHLHNQGLFTKNIEFLIPVETQFNSEKEISEIQKVVEDDIFSILPAYGIHKNIDKEQLLDRVKIDKSKDSKIRYKFFDELEQDGSWIYRDNKEDFTKEGGYLDRYLKKREAFYNDRVHNLIDIIKTAQNKNLHPDQVDFLGKKSFNPKIPIAIQNVLGRYCDPSFKILEIPALLDNNILAFERQGSGILEFVMISANRLDKLTDVNGQGTVLGKFLTDEEAIRLTEMNALDSKYGNLELIKLISILNTLQTQDPNFLQGKLIGPMQILNPEEGFPWCQNLQDAFKNFSFLCLKTEGAVKNNISKIPMVDQWEFFAREVLTITQNAQIDDNLKSILSCISMSNIQLEERILALSKLIQSLRNYDPTLKSTDQTSNRHYDMNKPSHYVYVMASDLYNQLHNINITPEGSISKYGLHISELIRIFSIPFIKDHVSTNNYGEKSTGLFNGLSMSSPQTVQQEMLKRLNQYYQAAYTNVRANYMEQRMRIQNITKEWAAKKHGQTYRVLYNDYTKEWEQFLVHEDNKVGSDLMLKNPYDNAVYMNSVDRQFLKEILWEINKFQLKIKGEAVKWTYKNHAKEIDAMQEVIDAINSGRYFQLPLRRASHFQRLKKLGSGIKITEQFSTWWESLRDEYDPRFLHNSQAEQLKNDLNKDSLKMYNQYQLSPTERAHYLESKNNPYQFEFDLDLLASDVAFQAIRKSYFEHVLVLTETISTVMHFQAQKGSRKWEKELSYIEDQKKISITNESLIDDEWQDTVKVAGALKQVNSLVVLAFRPLQFIKELTFGQFTNYSRAWALKGLSGEISIKNVFLANKVVWGQSMKKYGNAFVGEGDIADFTMCSALNKDYGFANEDLNRLVDNSTLQAMGITHNFSKWMYIANSAPDYFNRLTLFIAKMMQDGCWDAHSLNKDGNLVYDFIKDKRFSKLRQFGLNSNSTDKEYLEQKGLYYAMIEDFERDGFKNLKQWDSSTESYKLVPLPRAYTTKQRNSIKEVSDLAYGFYDHETKSQIDHKVFGLIWKQFMTFWTAKTTLWFRGKPKNQGDNTSQGKYAPATRDGKILYRRYVIDPNTNKLLTVQLITEDEMTADEKGKLEIQWQWQGDYVEGIIYSIMHTFYDIFHADWKDLRNNKTQIANLKLALHDILLGLILYKLLMFIFSDGSNKMKDVKPLNRTILRAMQDMSPTQIASLQWEPGFVNTLENFKMDIPKLFSSDVEIQDLFAKRIGSVKDLQFSEQ